MVGPIERGEGHGFCACSDRGGGGVTYELRVCGASQNVVVIGVGAMATEKKFTFYNVGNGQSVLTTLDDDTHLLFDLLQKPEDAGEDDKRADVKAKLLDVLPYREGEPHLRVGCFSHADHDHCAGFARVFQCDDSPADGDDLIVIDELWVTAKLFREKYDDASAKALQREARRRLKLWIDPKKRDEAKWKGNRLVVFGNPGDDDELKKLPSSQRFTAGQVIDAICGESRSDFEMFVHSPFREVVEDDSINPNDGSLIGQVVVKKGGRDTRMLIGGDASCAIWKQVYEQTKIHRRLYRLDWDIFFCPHHGSYRFFTEKQGKEGREEAENNPADTSMKILKRGKDGGWLVCSSRPVKKKNYDDGNPPHKEAIKHYEKRADEIEGEFVCLMQHPNESSPKPLILRITDGGVQEKVDASSVARAASIGVASRPSRWG